MIWKQNREITNEYIEEVSNSLEVHPLLLRIFLNRHNDLEMAKMALRDFDSAIIAPELLVNAQAVANRISEYIKNGNRIYIHADYDADGLNSGFIMYQALKEAIEYTNSEAELEICYPERENGYGLSFYFAEQIIKGNRDKDILVITVDNGVAQTEQIKLLKGAGIEVVVTDHHMSKSEGVPDCLICDPHNAFVEQDETYHHLCGAGVAFKVCELVQKNFGYHDMYKFVANVAIATITDVMPLNSENISFVKYGLDIINSEFCPVGIRAMKDFLGIKIVNPAHLAWEIGPRLNACGRMNNTAIGGELMAVEDYERAVEIVNEIELINDERKECTKKAAAQLDKMNFDNDEVCITPLDNIPEGIVGIIAGKSAEKFNKPSIVVSEKVIDGVSYYKGSSRTAKGLDLHYLFNIEVKKGNMDNFGGHSQAAGVMFKKERLQDLITSLNENIKKLLSESSSENNNEEEEILLIDELIEINHLNEETFNLINQLPYDKADFHKPVFAIVDCEVEDYIPTAKNPQNLWLTIKQGKQKVKLWCEGMTEVYKSKNCPKKVHLAGYIEKNFMFGRPYTFKVVDLADAS